MRPQFSHSGKMCINHTKCDVCVCARLLIPSKLPNEKPGYLTVGQLDRGSTRLEGYTGPTKLLRLYSMAYTPSGFWSRLITQILVMLRKLSRSSKGDTGPRSPQGQEVKVAFNSTSNRDENLRGSVVGMRCVPH